MWGFFPLSLSLSIYLFIYISIPMSIYLSIHYLSIYLFVYLCIDLSIYLYIYLSIHLCIFYLYLSVFWGDRKKNGTKKLWRFADNGHRFIIIIFFNVDIKEGIYRKKNTLIYSKAKRLTLLVKSSSDKNQLKTLLLWIREVITEYK